ncbi:MAG: hypothetical protein DYG90_00675 [Chloroflexi bacterium CFX6]|nr:hypothetical protein [Chloroflexi bacterium CFX6]
MLGLGAHPIVDASALQRVLDADGLGRRTGDEVERLVVVGCGGSTNGVVEAEEVASELAELGVGKADAAGGGAGGVDGAKGALCNGTKLGVGIETEPLGLQTRDMSPPRRGGHPALLLGEVALFHPSACRRAGNAEKPTARQMGG